LSAPIGWLCVNAVTGDVESHITYGRILDTRISKKS